MQSQEYRKRRLAEDRLNQAATQATVTQKTEPESPINNPGFIERVLQRAERIESDKAKAAFIGRNFKPVAKDKTPSWMKLPSAKDQWVAVIEELMKTETAGSRRKAIEIATKRYRGILHRMRTEANTK